MKWIRVGVCVVAGAGWLSARPSRAASAVAASAQGDCAPGSAARGEGKFTGQISGTPAANTFEVVAGKRSATTSYTSAVLACENGQLGSTSALAAGATVAVFGPIRSQGGDRDELSATKILLTGTPRANMRSTAAVQLETSGSAATNPGAGTIPGAEQSRNESLAAGGQNRPGASNLPGTIACSPLEFSVSVRDAVTGKAVGRASTTPIVCRKAADQVAVQLMEEAVTARRMANLTLSWQNQTRSS